MYKGINSYSRSRNKKQKNSRVYFLNKNKTRSEFMKGGEKSHTRQDSPFSGYLSSSSTTPSSFHSN